MRFVLTALSSSIAATMFYVSPVAAQQTAVPTPGTWLATLGQAEQNSLYWIGDWETGNTSQWADNGQPWVTGPGASSWNLQTSKVHSGTYAMSTTIDTRTGEAGVRWPRRNVPGMSVFPTTAYYSTWLRLDSAIDAPWYNVMQWKHETANGLASDPTWSIDIAKHSDGRDYYYLYNYIGNDGNLRTAGSGSKGDAAIPIPTGQWTHLETFYKWASDTTGAITVYEDGQLIFQQTNVRTKFNHADSLNHPVQWTINAYGDQISPAPSTIYFDDAAISGMRLGSSLVQTPISGDYNGNGSVDAADYTFWRKSTNKSQAEYNFWRSHFGQSASGSAAVGAFAVIPEPTAGVLVLVGLLPMCLRQRRRA